jgi:hypothetical protein
MLDRFQAGRESPMAARSTATVRKPRVTEEEAIQQAWDWFVRNRDAEDIAFADVVTRVRALLPTVTAERVRAGFERRFAANPRARFGG